MVLDDPVVSTYFVTTPVDMAGSQADFLNAAAVGNTGLSARDLLTTLLGIESERGRERPHAGAARTLDLDLVLYGGQIIEEPDLVVPHPRFRQRRFVLEPLAQIAPGLRDPVTGRTVADLLQQLM